ncbi:hypothetical protein L8W69_06465 [Campylobacter sp. CNRCH_2016_3089]|uniref:hypothetical protein n=1 Tax=Campylobacter sp. CNRCH_2016_3089 TaxID=2911609 RepID=UPI0021E6875F|nr:hypothetical protein [Campylobacter sp. CNRCH_2016_3089]MCV3508860.1 hypothetical protein [Campylobacter sp. CNRCH_2016_3089]
MTRKQFNEIKERLAKYREIRHLTYENQQEAFLGNAFEKISEYFRANNDLEKIDALCDIVIFCFNAFDFDYNYYYEFRSSNESIEIYKLTDAISEVCYREIKKFYAESYIPLIISYCRFLIKNLGFDFYKCMIETIKEIESKNIGNYCEYENKFYQMPGAYTLDEAYKLAFYRESNEPSLNGKTKPKLHKENNIMWTFKYKSALGGDMKLNFIKWYKADYEDCKL